MEKFYTEQIKRFFGSIITIGYCGVYFLVEPSNPYFEWAFTGIFMFLLGIPHGAGDHLLIKKWKKDQGLTFSLLRFTGSYLAVMLLYGLLWYYFPKTSFVIFILISIFHFGDFENEVLGNESIRAFCQKMSLGLGILGWLIYFHYAEVKLVLGDMIWVLPAQLPTYLPFLFFLCIILGFRRQGIYRYFNTLITIFLGCFLPLLPAFVCYFAACHAVYSLRDMSEHLQIKTKSLLAKLLPFSCLSFLMGFIFLKVNSNIHVIYYFFIFLSLLTMPHFWLMHQHVKKTNPAQNK
jgi:Brp/Blh family beta-carotene 15,15'-monooxygenase